MDQLIKNMWNMGVANWGMFSAVTGIKNEFFDTKLRMIEEKPWFSKNKVVFTDSKQKTVLRKFTDRTSNKAPVVIVTPEAGQGAKIGDYAEGQSLVATIKNAYGGDVYLVEKLPATQAHIMYDLNDCINSLGEIVDFIGVPVRLVGLCQGGWQSAIYAALNPKKVSGLDLQASPIDFHVDGGISVFPRQYGLDLYKGIVAMNGGNMPGAMINLGFMMMNPYERFIKDDMDLLENVNNNNVQGVSRRNDYFDWFNMSQPLPGKMFVEIVEHLFIGNKLIKKELIINGEIVDLDKIECEVRKFTGNKDAITPHAQLESVAFPNDKGNTRLPYGHIGIFMSKGSQKVYTELYGSL